MKTENGGVWRVSGANAGSGDTPHEAIRRFSKQDHRGRCLDLAEESAVSFGVPECFEEFLQAEDTLEKTRWDACWRSLRKK